MLGGDAVSGVGAPAWEWGDLCRASPRLTFPCSVGIAVGRGETCTRTQRPGAVAARVAGPQHFSPFFPHFAVRDAAPGAEPLLECGVPAHRLVLLPPAWSPGAAGWGDLVTEPLAISCLSPSG